MSCKKWTIEFNPDYWTQIHEGKKSEGNGFYKIKFEDSFYGFILAQAWDELKTGEILCFIEQMLNDAHNLALSSQSIEKHEKESS